MCLERSWGKFTLTARVSSDRKRTSGSGERTARLPRNSLCSPEDNTSLGRSPASAWFANCHTSSRLSVTSMADGLPRAWRTASKNLER